MGIGLAIGGGLLQGASQGVADDVTELLKERAADLANQNQKDLLGIQHGNAVDLQNSSQAFNLQRDQINNQSNRESQAQAQSAASALADKQIAATAQQGNLSRANSLAIANIGQDEKSPQGAPWQDKTGAMWQSFDDGSTEPVMDTRSGQQIIGPPSTTTKADPAIAAGAAAGKSPYGGFDANAATAATTWYKGQQGAGAPAAAAPGAPPLQPVTPSLAQPTPGGATPGAGGGAPAPAAPAQPAPSKYPEGAILKQGNATFKVINGQPVYQGTAQ